MKWYRKDKGEQGDDKYNPDSGANKDVFDELEILRAQMEASTEGIILVDKIGRIKISNTKLSEMFEIPDVIIDKGNFEELLDYILNNSNCSGDSLETIKQLSVDRKKKHTDRIEMKNGKAFMWYSSPLIDSKNHCRGRAWYFCDISEIKNKEDEHISTAERLKILFEEAPDAYFLFDLSGKILGGNKISLELTGFSREDLIGKNFLEANLIPKKDLRKALKLLNKNAEGHPTGPEEFILNKKDGQRIVTEVRTFPINVSGNIQVLGIARDISARCRTEAEVIEKSYQLSEQVRQLNCLYEISRFMVSSDLTIEKILQKTVEVLPTALRYPESAVVNVTLNSWSASSEGWRETEWLLCSNIVSDKGITGKLKISYTEEKPEMDEGPFLKEERNLVDAVGILLGDFIQRKEVELLLSESEKKFRVIGESAQEAIIMINHKGIITFWNKAAEKIFGYTEMEMNGRELHKIIVPEYYYDLFKEGFSKFIKTGTGYAIGRSLELTALRKGGEEFAIDLSLSAVKIKGEWNTIGILRDISGRKQAEETLVKSEEQFRILFENATLGLYRTHSNGNVIMANPALIKILGFSKIEEIQKISVRDIFLDIEDREKFKAIIEREGVIYGFETRWKRKDGAVIDIRESARTIRDEEGKVLFYEGIVEDITESKKAELVLIEAKEKAEEMNRLKSNLLANMSHELRTPLSGILGFAEMLNREIEDSFHKELLNGIHQSGLRLLKTLNSLLNLANIESEKVELKLAETDVSKVILRIIEIYTPTAANKNLSFGTDIKINNAKVLVDENLLNQVLSNLMDNAFAYTKEGNINIVVDGEKTGDKNWVLIKIADTGIGIPPGSKDFIFEPFRQASEGPSRRFEGAGVGLTLAKRYVELMGGKISFESEIQKGTTFCVKFPLYKRGTETSDKEKSRAEKFIQSVSDQKILLPRVLIVEDEHASIEITKYFLKDIFEVDNINNGKEALQMLLEKDYDAIIMDINLVGEMDGIEATREIRKIPQYKSTPILALTAYAMREDEAVCREAGCTHYMSKPVTRDELINYVANAVKNGKNAINQNNG